MATIKRAFEYVVSLAGDLLGLALVSMAFIVAGCTAGVLLVVASVGGVVTVVAMLLAIAVTPGPTQDKVGKAAADAWNESR